MDPISTVDRLATGEAVTILAVVVVAEFLALIVLFRRVNQVQDQRIEDMRVMSGETRSLLEKTNAALSALTDPLEEAVRELRVRR